MHLSSLVMKERLEMESLGVANFERAADEVGVIGVDMEGDRARASWP